VDIEYPEKKEKENPLIMTVMQISSHLQEIQAIGRDIGEKAPQ
jgi:hypothetical protein